MEVSMTINNQTYTRNVPPRMLLVHFLRDVLGLTGTHVGCDTSQCGACVVIKDGLTVKACTLLAVQCDGATVTTVEGLTINGALHPIQEGFWEEHGLQCGYCTPGVMMAAYQILQDNPNPTEEQIRDGLEGSLCRCTGYHNIVRAIKYAAQKLQSAQEGAAQPVATQGVAAGSGNQAPST